MGKFFKVAKKEKIKLKEHQQRVVDKLSNPNQPGLLLYHGLGSGKTISSIMAADKNKSKTTVVTPASLQENYKKEIKKTHTSSKNFDVMSYNKFTTSKDVKNKDMLVLDEAHAIRNLKSQRAQKVMDNVSKFNKVVLLTGTPIQNKPHEIANLINAVAKEKRLPADEKAFNKKYLKVETKHPGIIDRIFRGARDYKETSATNLDDFRKKTKGLVDYHKPKATPDYPTVTSYTDKVDMSPEQEVIYKYYSNKLPRSLKYKISKNIAPSKKDITQLNSFLSATRQIGNTSSKFSTGDKKASPKIRSILSKIKKSDLPSVVYSNYLESGINPLSAALTKNKISHGVFTGSLNKDQKSDLVKKYNKGKLKALLVSSSGGEGLDLKNTGTVHIMEPHWNEAKTDQVIGRAARYKSHESLPKNKRKVKVYKYLSDAPNTETADEYLYAMGRKKKKLNNQFLRVLRQNG